MTYQHPSSLAMSDPLPTVSSITAKANGPATPVVIDLTTPETIDLTGDYDLKPQLNAQK